MNKSVLKKELQSDLMLKLLPIYEEFGIAKTKVFNYILESLSVNDHLIDSQREISHNLDVSLKTVSDTFIFLQDIGLLEQAKRGVYVLNAEFFTSEVQKEIE